MTGMVVTVLFISSRLVGASLVGALFSEDVVGVDVDDAEEIAVRFRIFSEGQVEKTSPVDCEMWND